MCRLPIRTGAARARGRGQRLGAADLGPRAGRELEHAERLGDVVVGAGIEEVDFLMLGVSRRQHDDRHRGPLANLAAHVHAGHVGQTEIEHDEVGPRRRRRLDPGRPVRRFLDPGGDVVERVANSATNLRLVVDDEDEIGIRHEMHGGGNYS